MYQALEKEKSEARIILQVHDELILDTPEKEIDRVIELTTEAMKEATLLDVPLEIDIGIGDNWDQAHWWIYFWKTQRMFMRSL